MRLLVLIPDLVARGGPQGLHKFFQRHPRLARLGPVRRRLVHPGLRTEVAWGGSLNNMRHAAVARALGADTRLVCPSGRDTYGEFNVVDVPYLRWDERRDDDVVLIPDFCSELADEVRGPAIVYLQSPLQLRRKFDYRQERVLLWTNSPFMLERCRHVFPDKDIPIVPNIIDDAMFQFVPQREREPGHLLVFPRKGADFIAATEAAYRRRGGRYWRFTPVDGMPLRQLAQRMRRPQAFLASSDVDGCALPPQESMACGIVVVGRTARTANFAMQHGKTAMVAETAEEAAECLLQIEDHKLREALARGGADLVRRYFPDAEPRAHWHATLTNLGFFARLPT